MALLLLRFVFAAALLVQGTYYLREPDAKSAKLMLGLVGIGSGAMLLIGLLTPIVGVVVGLGGIGIGYSLFPSCTRNLFEPYLPLVFAATILFAIIILGPGAFSVDARLFGRREIIVPRR
jgi:uncharacterized membrane protein YphA (DoxX/SURF4 family)